MAISKAVVSRVRVLAITHILVGVLLSGFGIADTATYVSDSNFDNSFGCFGIGIGIWMCIAGGLGIPGSTLQRTRRSNLFASVFMGFFITSAVFGEIIITVFVIRIANTNDLCQGKCPCFGNGCGNVTCDSELESNLCRNKSYNTVMGLASMILVLGIIEFATGISVAICVCMMRPCCTDLEERQPLVNSVRG